MPWLTGDQVPAESEIEWHCVPVPLDDTFRRGFFGALLELTYTANHEKVGDVEPEDAAYRFIQMYGAIRRCRPMPVGAIVEWPGGTVPEGFLECNGQSLATADYPDLFSALGYTWGGSGGSFSLPDFRGRSSVGVGQGSGLTNRVLAATGGEENHTLITAEMPRHLHSIAGLWLGPTEAGIGANAWIYNGAQVKNTLNTGEDAAHNNMPPFVAVRKIILATL
jgi:microcystin-dependent protein